MKALIGDPSRELNAEFDLMFQGDRVSMTIHSRGGSASRGNQRNPEYELLVQTLLERLTDSGAELLEVLLASKTVAKLSPSQRRIDVEGFNFPVHLPSVGDLSELRYAIRRAVAKSHSKSDNPLHGNATKRIELVASCPTSPLELVAVITDGKVNIEEDESHPGGIVFREGRPVLRTHMRRERNQSLVRAAKSKFKALNGRLFCEVCNFDFLQVYGQLGEDFIEAHHEDPLSDRDEESQTRIEDLRMVCPNCHRMLHRSNSDNGLVPIDQMRQFLNSKS